MKSNPKIIIDIFIIFTQSKCKSWIMKFIKKDFSHVFAMKKSPGGQFWIVIDAIHSYLDCDIVLVEKYPHPRLYVDTEAVILPVKAKIGTESRWSFCVFNCVEVVKALLGVKAFWVWTPWQLYKYLIKWRPENV